MSTSEVGGLGFWLVPASCTSFFRGAVIVFAEVVTMEPAIRSATS
ncbi:hypothetical protein [Kribbella sp. C-35]